jgi:hypothetical protein
MVDANSISNNLFAHILEKSLFTPKQISIISKRLQGGEKPTNISSGAYYRQVGQCREKVEAILYSAILLQSTGVLEPEALAAMGRMAEQLGVMFASDSSSDVALQARTGDVMSVMDQLVKRMSKL